MPKTCESFMKPVLFRHAPLIEGFGQVFLEALSYGCPVLSTVNTCLPDLGGESDGIFLTEVGNLDQLTYKLSI
jgi:glycosyltransferase involved in cell wall biosynthesis